mgnify:CR=1 FL=1
MYKKDEPGAWRFCFQCGKLEPLEVFDAKQRSCRTRLLQRRKPHKRPGDNLADPLLQQQPQQQQPQQKQRPKHRAKRTPRSNCSHQRGSKSPVTENSAGEEEQQQQLQDLMQWQYSCPLQEEQGPHQDLGFSTWGYNADSFPTSPVAAAAAQWQQQLASHPAETQDAAVPIPTPAAAPTAALPPLEAAKPHQCMGLQRGQLPGRRPFLAACSGRHRSAVATADGLSRCRYPGRGGPHPNPCSSRTHGSKMAAAKPCQCLGLQRRQLPEGGPHLPGCSSNRAVAAADGLPSCRDPGRSRMPYQLAAQ